MVVSGWLTLLVTDKLFTLVELLDGSDFSGGDSGSLSLNSVFPNNDQIVGTVQHIMDS
jgi:hypothetical protein